MYLFYIDESGNRDPQTEQRLPDGTTRPKDHIYVLTAVSLHEMRWYGFETTINGSKQRLIDDVHRVTGKHFDLADVEVHSSVVRRPKTRNNHPFFRFLTRRQLEGLTNLLYRQLDYHNMSLFAVVVDKRKLEPYMTEEKLHRKAYELLLERIQSFLSEYHRKHFGVIVVDDVSRQMNRSLAMKHSYFQRRGTSAGLLLRNIVETPFFVRSELSNGIQLADLCAYNVYRAFRYENSGYDYFARIVPRFYRSRTTHPEKLDGLKVFPDDSELVEMASRVGVILAKHFPGPPRIGRPEATQ